MKSWIIITIFGGLLFAAHQTSFAQGSQTVQIEKPFKSRLLGGDIAIHWNGGPISGVSVDDCSNGWHDVLASTVSDENGRFELRNSNARVHYLRLTAPGFDITLVKVIVTRWSRHPKLHLEMTLGT